MDKIYRLTSDDNSTLHVDLEDFEGKTAYAEYNKFGVMSENDKYKLILGNYLGDSLRFLSLCLLKNKFLYILAMVINTTNSSGSKEHQYS